MRTIGRRYSGPRRQWADTCDYCGVRWHRSELGQPDENGFLACPDDRDGRVEKTLDYLRAAGASEPSTVRGKTRQY